MLKNIKQIVIFIGPEGSGKTVNALRLKNEVGVPYISTGDIIRDLATNDFETKYGDLCRKMFSEATYLDGHTLMEILTNRLKMADTANGFILDGGLRTVEETKGFRNILKNSKRDNLPLKVIFLKTPTEVSVKRLTGVGGRNRYDDTLEKVNKRLNSFYSTLSDRLETVKNEKWELIEIDATPSLDKVYKEVLIKWGDAKT